MTIQVIEGLFADVNNDSLIRIISDRDLNKPNNWFEVTHANKPTHPFLDIDNHSEYKGNKLPFLEIEFLNLVLRMEKKIINRFPNLTLLNASDYNAKKYKANGEFDTTERKISFKITDHTKRCDNMKICKEYCLNVFSKELKECLGDDAKYIDIDSSVYRNGRGKMSCANAYKFPQDKSRIRQLVNGELQHTYLQYMFGDEEIVNLIIPTHKPKPKSRQIKVENTPMQSADLPDTKTVNRFYDYACLIDKSQLGEREKWLKFTLVHINLLGIADYENYDNFLKGTTGYEGLANQMKYEELYKNKDNSNEKLGWGYLYQLAYANNKDAKLKLDNYYREPFNIFTMLKKKPNVEDNDIQAQIDELEDNEEMKTSVKNRKIKELKKQQKKQEEEQTEAKYKAMKSYFELYHFKLNNPFAYAKIVNSDDIVMRYNKGQFKDYCDNIEINTGTPFTLKWFKDPTIKTYDTMDFIPYGVACPNNVFNLFTGFDIEKERNKKTNSFNNILETVKLNSGDNDDTYNYLLNYLAHLVQKPAILPEVSIVVIGEQGTGKSSLWENFGDKLLGKKYALQSSNPDDIIGRFNMNKNKLLVVMEETESKNTFTACSQIKTLITQPTLNFENKGKDKFQVRNCGRYIFISNNQTPVKIEQSDRRFMVMECSNRHIQDKVFFGKVNEEWNDPQAVKGFYDFLMKRDISNFNPSRDRIITEAYHDMKSVTVPHIARWLEQKYYDYNSKLASKNPTWASLEKKRKAGDLYNSYTKWLDGNGYKSDSWNSTKFGRDIKKYKGITHKRTNIGVSYLLCYKEIFDGLVSKGYIKNTDDISDDDEVTYSDESDNEFEQGMVI